jgi:hypothetical protein
VNVRESPYAEFLEDVIRLIMEHQPTKIAVSTLNPDDTYVTGYFGDCNQQDKALLAHSIYSDSIMDIVLANSKMILEAAEEDSDETQE